MKMSKTHSTDTDILSTTKKTFNIGLECLAQAVMFHYFKIFSFTLLVYKDSNRLTFFIFALYCRRLYDA